jgi:hypothetical protein
MTRAFGEIPANESGWPDTPPTPGSGFEFPVGSVFISTVATNPGTSLGYGTWLAVGEGQVLVGYKAGDPDFGTAGASVGAKTQAAAGTVSAPTFTGDAMGTHSHGAGTLVPSAHSGAAVADHTPHTHTYTEVPNHVHVQNINSGTTGGSSGYTPDTSTNGSTATAISTANPTGGVATGTTAGPSATLTHSVTQPSNHTMSGTSEAASAGTPSGTVSAPTFTGSQTPIIQPSLVVYMFVRTA